MGVAAIEQQTQCIRVLADLAESFASVRQANLVRACAWHAALKCARRAPTPYPECVVHVGWLDSSSYCCCPVQRGLRQGADREGCDTGHRKSTKQGELLATDCVSVSASAQGVVRTNTGRDTCLFGSSEWPPTVHRGTRRTRCGLEKGDPSTSARCVTHGSAVDSSPASPRHASAIAHREDTLPLTLPPKRATRSALRRWHVMARI